MKTTLTKEETLRRLHQLYDENLRTQLETEANREKFVTFDVLSGDYEVGRDYIQNVLAVKARHEKAQTVTLRIGAAETFSKGFRGKYAA